MTIGEKIHSLRTSRELSQEKFAELLDVSRQSVSKWETDSSVPEIDKMLRICDIFGISLDELTGRTEGESNSENEELPFKDDYDDSVIRKRTPFSKDSFTIILADKDKEARRERRKNRPKPSKKKIIAIITAFCIIISLIVIPLAFDKQLKHLWWELHGGQIEYTNVLVHGLGGWGEDAAIDSDINYWGGGSDDLVEYLNAQGFRTVAPSIGPVSSTWDRCCELYAQLTGTTVDYGEVHSKKHGHERYGRTYDTPLVENWGQEVNGGQLVKINLIGHSFGGTTARYLAFLLEYGNESELLKTGNETSPLFTGNKGEWVHSVTTLATPHNGSSLTEIIDTAGELINVESVTDLLISLCFYMDSSNGTKGLFDMQLDQFGLKNSPAGKTAFTFAVEKVLNSCSDHAGYELSPDGAINLNHTIKIIDQVYYFSYSYSTTFKGEFLDIQVPSIGTLPILMPFSSAMGAYKGITDGGILIENNWRENDGLVNVVSAKYPFGEDHCEYDKNNIKAGIWNVVPTKSGDHGNVIGLNADTEETHRFWTDLLTELNSLPRIE